MCEVVEVAGCILGLAHSKRRGGYEVVEVESSSDDAVCLQEGDCLLEVDGAPIGSCTSDELRTLARGFGSDTHFLVERAGSAVLVTLHQITPDATPTTADPQDLLRALDHFRSEGQRMERMAEEQYTLRLGVEEDNQRLRAQVASLKSELLKRDSQHIHLPLHNSTNTPGDPLRKQSPSKRLERQAATDVKRLRGELLASQRKAASLLQENAALKAVQREAETQHAQELISVRSARSGEGMRALQALKKQNDALRAALEASDRAEGVAVAAAAAAPTAPARSGSGGAAAATSLAAVRNCLLGALERVGVEPCDDSIEGLTEALVQEVAKVEAGCSVSRQSTTHGSLPRTAEEYFEGVPSVPSFGFGGGASSSSAPRRSESPCVSPEAEGCADARWQPAVASMGPEGPAPSPPHSTASSGGGVGAGGGGGGGVVTPVSLPQSNRSPPQPVRHPSLAGSAGSQGSSKPSPPQPLLPSWACP